MVPISTHIEVVDYNAQAETRTINEVLAAGTLASQLQRICTIFGWTLHPNQVTGPTMAALPCDYASARSVLDALSTATQYPWEKDEWDRLRMFQPASEAAPVDLIEGNDVTDGDIQVAPSRQNYFNRIVLRFSNDAIASWAYLATTGNFTSGETVTIGSQVYQFRAVLSAVAGYVLLGADVTESLGNLAAAVIGGAGAGTAYAAATPVNASAEGYVSQYGTWLTTRALTPGAAGNAIACASTALNAMWIWEGGGATPTLGGGADKALTNVAIAEDAAFATDPRELVVQSPETTSRAAAETLAANVLAVKLIQPKTVRYVTYALGLRPGQTQTACVPKRNLNGTIVITNVSTDNPVGNLVRRVVTAVTGGVVQAAERFQDTYRQWSGSVSGNQASVSGGGGGGGGGGTATPSIIGLGGSTVESWPAPVSNGLVAANATQVLIDTARRGSTVGTCYARMRTTAGTVTAYLWNVTTSSVVGTSVPVTTAFDANGVGIYQTVSFGVSLTPGADLYEIRLSGSVSGADLNLGYGYVE
jgi:hypothetical protein